MAYEKYPAADAAKRILAAYFPDCDCAILAGSTVRGEATETSDLDLVIFDRKIAASYRESFIDFGWPVEAFVHNFDSYKTYFEDDIKRARPSLPRMVAEGTVIKDDGELEVIRQEARDLLARGPEKWNAETIRLKRYFITDALDDFEGSKDRAEQLFIANTLAELLSEFVLRTNGQWIGASKWIVRAMKRYDAEFASIFTAAFDDFYRKNEKHGIIDLADHVLKPHGGRLFEGFSVGKPR
ncbi:nucleotidyltransferase domain-containing protein [Indiicoccus explosivorum]|uniref:nucleotidyltransferase domain-containing protein n=1 Tax=Indiicoccus explosivorum TaxID=1917864 RepID=UPI000B4493FE|nr:nucleotidyltransferase domain-containing protein [Indiicoccus explosivorum]